MAHALVPIGSGLPGTSHWLEIDDDIIAEDWVLRHDIEMICISVLVRPADLGAPLLVAFVGTEVCNHDDDALSGAATRTTTTARRTPGRGQVIAFAAAGAAPARAGGVVESL